MKQISKCKSSIRNKFFKLVKKNYIGWLFLMPVTIGIALFTFVPIVSSFYYSFFDYNLISPPKNFGLQNYASVLYGDESELFWVSMKNTITYMLISLPLNTVLSYLLALLLLKESKLNRAMRVLYYIPALMPGIVSAIVWKSILHVDYGLLNGILHDVLGLSKIDFFSAKNLMPTYLFMNLFALGGGTVMWIAQLKGIPDTLYEAAKIDGANRIQSFFSITLPMSTPLIFYKIIMGVIASLQIFEGPYILTGGNGGAGDALLFVVMRIYNKAFSGGFGVSSAMSWILFAFVGVISFVIFKTRKWVYYAEEE